MNEEQTVQALLTQPAGPNPWATRERRPASAERRSARVAAVVAALYIALVAATPLIVRYGPEADDHAAAAFVARMDLPRCGAASTADLRCARQDAAAATTRVRDPGDL